MRTTAWLVSIAVLAYAGLCLALFVLQRSLIYFPQPRLAAAGGTTLTLQVAEDKLVVTTRPHAGAKALIYFGGNAEDVSQNLSSFAGAFPDYAIYLLHYRGYGGSTGKPSEALLHADALVLFDQVSQAHTQISVVGRSLGSGVAIRLASQRPVAKLALVTPYDSIAAIAARQFPVFPVRWLLTDKFESWRHAPAIRVPTLLLAAEHDDLIPRASTERLLAAFSTNVASLVVVPGADHNSISNKAQYLSALRAAL